MTKKARLYLEEESTLRSEDKASIAILAMWSICFISTLAIITSGIVRQKLVFVYRLQERNNLNYISEAGARSAIMALLKEEPDKAYCALKESWSSNPSAFKDKKIGDGVCSIVYNVSSAGDPESFRWGMVDEERKLNINSAGIDELQRLFQIAAGLELLYARDLAASIVDWRDSDSNVSIPAGSAEDSYYMIADYSYQCKDAPFEILEEVLLVKGMSEEIFAKTQEFMTIYGDGAVNINTAGPQVLLSIGLSQSLVNKILVFRAGTDSLEATADDGVFISVGDIVSGLKSMVRLTKGEEEELAYFCDKGRLSVNSYFFRINSVAHLRGKKNMAITACVTDRQGAIYYWQGA